MATIESYVQPRRLYRYRSTASLDRELDSILKGYLYCSPYMNLNDPRVAVFNDVWESVRMNVCVTDTD